MAQQARPWIGSLRYLFMCTAAVLIVLLPGGYLEPWSTLVARSWSHISPAPSALSAEMPADMPDMPGMSAGTHADR
jgi:hypothetical protein